ncbi:hypothetical protein SAMN03159355_01535 [Pseudomonas sp. NFPP10]|uniref:hypothetical protein n=1 Tax=unclassified Pseudomonas TaxID=196821 RepID=UPI00088DF0C0|nr:MULTISPECIES: hypothetical protein [unclassified Pseudomonas]SDA18180.1 hypothetical protein SAMN03159465_02003 [Pseudomonas sp. NFPP12]SEK99718.1 hypothetical protein SAMN03159355_01535 [Pseudomonas sp. NFPP10]SFI58414.1 hypothetical protein SAMN03159416_01953 [Pseudomonas sp. NFPP08]SFM43259.1 hypothetical protein SAMN03159476_01585 [Pseudomonas sp. NFPP05]SFX31727.1 hypothetical protein SAMN03159479_01535 [Pseudomonas sp. NFPP09]
MQQSTEIAQVPVARVQFYIAGRRLIRIYAEGKCVGFSETYKFAQIKAAEFEKAAVKQEVH